MSLDEQPVFLFDGDDPELSAAYGEAQRTFRYFWREMTWERRRIIPALGLAIVKVGFWDGDSSTPPRVQDDGTPAVEHMWVGDVAFDGRTVTGTLMNDPSWLKSVKSGERVEVPLGRIEDWMYSMDGRAYGGFTVNVMRQKMSASERKGHDDAWGLDFGDPETVELVPNWAARAKKGFLSKLFGGKSPPGDPDVEHPMSENMAPKLEEALASNPSMRTSADERGFTMLHELALGGSAAGVRVMLAHGADKDARTNDGRTAKDLAEAMGWPRVVAQL